MSSNGCLLSLLRTTYQFKAFSVALAEKENASGMIALIKKEYLDLKDISKEYEKVLVLDSIEIPGNVGTMVRTSDATDFDLIIMINKVTGFSHHKAISSSRGMFLKVPCACVEYQEAQDFLLRNNYNIYLGGFPYETYRTYRRRYCRSCYS